MSTHPRHSPADLDREFDAIILGAGPAGLAAAIYLGRYLRPTLVLNEREPRTRWHRPTAHNVLGFPAGIMRSQLLEWGRDHALLYPSVLFHDTTVTELSQQGELFRVTDHQGRVYASHGLILATGVEYRLPPLEGIFDYAGYSVHHCPECDGFKTQGKKVVVIGASRGAASMALNLCIWTRQLTICTNGDPLEFDPECRDKLREQHIAIHESPIRRLHGERDIGQLSALELADGTQLPCDAAFCNLGEDVPVELLRGLPLELHHGRYVKVDHRQRTNLPRCYAAGDLCAFSQTQLSVAMGQGATAAIWLHKEMLPECFRLTDRD